MNNKVKCIIKQLFTEGQEPISGDGIIDLYSGEIQAEDTHNFLSSQDIINLEDNNDSVGVAYWKVYFTYDNKNYDFDINLDYDSHLDDEDYCNFLIAKSNMSQFDKFKLFLLLNEDLPQSDNIRKNKI